MKNKTLTFDIETYVNYSLFALRDVANDNKLKTFEIRGEDESLTNKQIEKLKKILTKNTIVTYNGLKFDEPITAYALKENRDNIITAGIDGYLTKPVKSKKLYETISNFI